MSDLLSVKFTASNAVRGKRPYTIYEIEVRSSTTMPWLLYKRYRDFDNLHAQLQKLMTSNNRDLELSTFKLNLPPKRLIRSMSQDVVAKRQKELEEYLQKILSNAQLVRNQLILDFLTVPESLRAMLMRRKQNDSSSTREHDLDHRDSDSYGPSSPHSSPSQSEEEREVKLLLKELSLQKNRVRALGKFESWYFAKATQKKDPPNMRPELIKRLYVGDETHQGLVHSCRLLHSKVAWRASISLLVRLLDIERNKYARVFQEVFLTLQQGLYKEMYLHQHINETSQQDGFKIVKLIRDALPSLEPKFYVPDDDAWRQFEKWDAMQRDSFGVVGGGAGRRGGMREEATENSLRALNWNGGASVSEMAERVVASFKALAAESEEQYIKVGGPPQLKVRYRKEGKSEWKLKCTFAVEHPPSEVYRFLVREMVSKGWDATQSDMSWNTKIVAQQRQRMIDAQHCVVHQTLKCFNSPYKLRDFVLFTCLRPDEAAKRYLLVFASVSGYEELPESGNPNVQRAVMLPSGFEIRPTKDNVNKSHVSYRAHLTNESVLTVSADLLGETDELFQSMLRIEQLISASAQ